jgi:hypothetical protein
MGARGPGGTPPRGGESCCLRSIEPPGPPQVFVAEREDLALDARVQGAQQEAQGDADLDVVRRHGDVSGRTRSPETQRVAIPRVRPAEVVPQVRGHRRRETFGARQWKPMPSMKHDLAHRNACLAHQRQHTRSGL